MINFGFLAATNIVNINGSVPDCGNPSVLAMGLLQQSCGKPIIYAYNSIINSIVFTCF